MRQPWPTPRVWRLSHILPKITHSRSFSISPAQQYRPLETLENATLETFQQKCFHPERPAILPRAEFQELPALKHWFRSSQHEPDTKENVHIASLNVGYLQKHGADAFVPLELTESLDSNPQSDAPGAQTTSFRQFHAPLTLFLDWMRMAESTPQLTRLYLAQCQLLDLPPILRADFPTPDLVSRAGKGDVYDTNVWIGHPPTYTPLHRDPNPNLFVQLAGQKVVRLLAPADGQVVFGGCEEMMQGRERVLLDETVWGSPVSAGGDWNGVGFEARLGVGDGLFIPKGWWHSIKGVGEGVTASVNWWFR
ncbi:hypothetical protein N7508_000736 [Penicillium antarcticum]|uniref:uncharacterized protein n=1 Tax=Penicillium antarcticum TaxID=416450 RepID=UPI002390093A|nr:uncharacterized protein N7508_000736 [Penicillium antarcticum]KAJ5320453.1 hypothetical protein N7508_000736 [Penicillium antarcticum]